MIRSPNQWKSARPAGMRRTKIANSTCSVSPHPTTRQRMARRLWDRATPSAMMSASPTRPVSRLQGEPDAGAVPASGAGICMPGMVGARARAAAAVVSPWAAWGRSMAESPRQARPGMSHEPAIARRITAAAMAAPRRPPRPGPPRVSMRAPQIVWAIVIRRVSFRAARGICSSGVRPRPGEIPRLGCAKARNDAPAPLTAGPRAPPAPVRAAPAAPARGETHWRSRRGSSGRSRRG